MRGTEREASWGAGSSRTKAGRAVVACGQEVWRDEEGDEGVRDVVRAVVQALRFCSGPAET